MIAVHSQRKNDKT